MPRGRMSGCVSWVEEEVEEIGGRVLRAGPALALSLAHRRRLDIVQAWQVEIGQVAAAAAGIQRQLRRPVAVRTLTRTVPSVIAADPLAVCFAPGAAGIAITL